MQKLNKKKPHNLPHKKKLDDATVADFTSRASKGYIDDFLCDFGSIDKEKFGSGYRLRLSMIANRASEKSGFKPCYYQTQQEKRIYAPEQWTNDIKAIAVDEDADGFLLYDDNSTHRLLLVRKDFARKQSTDIERATRRAEENEKYISEILELTATVTPKEQIRYGLVKFSFAAENYSKSKGTLSDECRTFAILNLASERSGFSPCYYQETNGKRNYNSNSWELGTWDDHRWQYEFSNSIHLDNTRNGFYIGGDDLIYRKDAAYIAEQNSKAKEAAEKEKQAQMAAFKEEYIQSALLSGELHNNIDRGIFTLTKEHKLMVEKLSADSELVKAGLQNGDIVTSVEIKSSSISDTYSGMKLLGIEATFRQLQAGSVVTFTVQRGKKKKAQTLTIPFTIKYNETELRAIESQF